MPHRPHHNRIRSPWVGNGQSCTSSRAGHPQAANLFEAPSLGVETTARENALWVELRGEADLGNHEQLLAGLTRVRLDGDRIIAIGKGLAPWDAIDTGLFVFSPRIFNALDEAVAAGKTTLSAGVARLADEHRATATPERPALSKRKILPFVTIL